MTGCWLGLDFGTSSLKALVVDDEGIVRGRASAPYPSRHGAAGEAEQDPLDYLEAARRAIAGCGDPVTAVRGIGLSGQTPTILLVDRDGEPIRPALTWQDHRAGVEAAALAAELGDATAIFGTPLPWTAAYAPAKLRWLGRHEAGNVARTRWVLQPKDFVGLRLTGAAHSDPWSSKGLCNVLTHETVAEMFAGAGFTLEASPPLAQAWERRGTVTAAAAAAFGLPAGVPVSVGWSDALAAMLAVGAFDEPTGFVLTGTSSIVGISTERTGPTTARLLEIPRSCAPLAVVYGPTESAGASVDWIARLLGRDTGEVLALAARARPRTPLFVPYLAGERAPIWRTDVRGVLLGLAADDGPAELARAVVDGVALSELDVLAVAEEQVGAAAATVCVAGRGAAESPWREARLMALGRSLRLLAEADASALGAAMLAAAAAADGDLAAGRPLRGAMGEIEPSGDDRGGGAARLAAYRRAVGASLDWVNVG